MLSIDEADDIRPDQVVDLNLSFAPAPSGSGEMLFHRDTGEAVLVLLVLDRQMRRAGPAVVTFVRCSQSVFGYPNDEARGNPLLWNTVYGFYEIRDSPWARRLQTYNRQAFPDTEWSPWGKRHFIVTCHETTAQFLADEIRLKLRPGAFAAAVQDVCNRLLD